MGLALFNMVPAFPMDGGRVFRALMSGLIGRERATMIAAGLGRGLALAFGFYQLINAPSLGAALMPIALAAFVYMAAGAELAQVLAEGRRTRASGGRRYLDRSPGLLLGQPGQRRLAARPDPGALLGREPLAVALTPIVELGVAEAYELLTRHFGVTGLPPLEAIENEDWGRDSLLVRFQDFPAEALAEAGLTWDEEGT